MTGIYSMPRGNTARSARTILDKVIQTTPGMNSPENKLFSHWSEVVGSELVSEVELVAIKEGVLLLKCLSSSRKNELRFQKNAILTSANQVLGSELISDLRFV